MHLKDQLHLSHNMEPLVPPPPFIAFSVHKDDKQIKNGQIFTKAYLLSMGF